MSKYILVTGGAGYIGSHTIIELYKAGYTNIVVIDNLSNSSKISLEKVKEILRKEKIKCNIKFIQADIKDKLKLDEIFDRFDIDSVIHFAGLKSVKKSVISPLEYYKNNVYGTINLLESMKNHNCKKIVFSSSATVYGNPNTVPITEDFPVGSTINPYGTSKYMIERILQDLKKSDQDFRIAILRYFNPIGAHESGLIGEDPKGIPDNLMPFISQVAIGKIKYLSIFGNDYDTKDGTGIRDYVHVVDLANAHIKALEYISNTNEILIANIGTGRGVSVLEFVNAFEESTRKRIPYKIKPRRLGDIAECYADTSYANKVLDWKEEKSIQDACIDTWRWQTKNPNGYEIEY